MVEGHGERVEDNWWLSFSVYQGCESCQVHQVNQCHVTETGQRVTTAVLRRYLALQQPEGSLQRNLSMVGTHHASECVDCSCSCPHCAQQCNLYPGSWNMLAAVFILSVGLDEISFLSTNLWWYRRSDGAPGIWRPSGAYQMPELRPLHHPTTFGTIKIFTFLFSLCSDPK